MIYGIRFIMKRLILKSYKLTNAYYNLRFALSNLLTKTPLIIYQMGKVGSSSITESLKSSGINKFKFIYPVHTLTSDGIDTLRDIYYGKNFNSFTTPFSPRSKHLLESEYLRRQLDKGLHRKKWKIVTLVREPVARNVSTYFQIIDLLYPNFTEEYHTQTIKTDELIERFLNDDELRDQPSTWYDSQLKTVFGIDVFSSDFPTSKGYKIYESEHADVLLIRLESLNECSQADIGQPKIYNF